MMSRQPLPGATPDGASEAFASPADGTSNRVKGYFEIDLRHIYRLWQSGENIGVTAALLALGVNTDASNLDSRSGIDSIRRYAGLGPVGAQRAVEALINHHVVQRLVEASNRSKVLPRFRILPFPDAAVQARNDPGQSYSFGSNPAPPRPNPWKVRIPNSFVRAPQGATSTLRKLVEASQHEALVVLLRLLFRADHEVDGAVLHRCIPLKLQGKFGTANLWSMNIDWNREPGIHGPIRHNLFHTDHPAIEKCLACLEEVGAIEWRIYVGLGGPSAELAPRLIPLMALHLGLPSWESPAAWPAVLGHLQAKLLEGDEMHACTVDTLMRSLGASDRACVLLPRSTEQITAIAKIGFKDKQCWHAAEQAQTEYHELCRRTGLDLQSEILLRFPRQKRLVVALKKAFGS